MNKKITIILIALLSFTVESYGAASFAAQQAMAAQAATDQVGTIAADLEEVPSDVKMQHIQVMKNLDALEQELQDLKKQNGLLEVKLEEKNQKRVKALQQKVRSREDSFFYKKIVNSTHIKFIQKIAQYLLNNLKKATDKKDALSRTDFLARNLFDPDEGICAGISSVYLLAKVITEREFLKIFNTLNSADYKTNSERISAAWARLKIDQQDLSKDDLVWFNTAVQILLQWDGVQDLSDIQKSIVNRFIDLVVLFQQQDFRGLGLLEKEIADSFADECLGLENLEFMIFKNILGVPVVPRKKAVYDHLAKDQMIEILSEIVQPGHMVFFAAEMLSYLSIFLGDSPRGMHQVGIYKSIDGSITLFDANFKNFEPKVFMPSPDQISRLVEALLNDSGFKNKGGFEEVEIKSITFPETPLTSADTFFAVQESGAMAGTAVDLAQYTFTDAAIQVQELDYNNKKQVDAARDVFVDC